MPDNPAIEPASPDGAANTTIVTIQSGGVDIGGFASVGGDVVGRDKIVSTTYITGDQQYDVHGLANPYLGLQSFTYADHAKYAGREKLIAETVARLTTPDDPLALLFVTGASGSGKSSFMQAGVLPALEKHYGALSLKWAVFRPSRDPLATLADALWWQFGLPQLDAHADFGDFLKANTPPQQVNVIVIDQFEELFTQSAAQPRDALFVLLTHLSPFRSTRTHIIATMRADYLPELFALPALYDIAKRGIDLRVMSMDELREAIQQPLRATYPDNNRRFQPELVERLAQDAAEDAAYLPLLQVTLEEIWRKGTLTVGSYTNLSDAIKQRADKVLEYQDYDAAQPDQPRTPEEQAAISNLCLDLVDVSLDDEARRDVRRRRSKDELVSGAPERVRLIDALTQARLLSVNTEDGEHSHIEVDLIHETLLSNWDRLRQAIAERRHELRQRVRFEQQLKEWIGQNRSDDYLLSGVRLAEARDLERRDDVALHNADAKDFVRHSVEREEARHQKELDDARKLAEAERLRAEAQTQSAAKLRRILVVVGLLALAAIVLGVLAGVFGVQSNESANANATLAAQNALVASTAQAAEISANTQRDEAQRQARIASSRELATAAVANLISDPSLAVLLAMQSVSVTHSLDKTVVKEAEDAVARAVQTSRMQLSLTVSYYWGIGGIALSPDGMRLATVSSGWINVWDVFSGQKLLTVTAGISEVNSIVFSPDGMQLGTAGDDGMAKVWDAFSGRQLLTVTASVSRVNTVVFSPDGMQLATASDDGTAKIWGINSGKEQLALTGHTGTVNSVVFSADGDRLATASDDRTAKIWNAVSGANLLTIPVHTQRVTQIAFSPDGKRLATGNDDGTVEVWDTSSGIDLLAINAHTKRVNSIAFSPDGKRLATCSDDGTAKVWDAARGGALFFLMGHSGPVREIVFSSDGKRLATGGYDGTAKIWDASGWEPIVTTLAGHSSSVLKIVFSPDGRRLATASTDGTAKVWDTLSGKELFTLFGHTSSVDYVAFNPDGTQLATASADGTVKVWSSSSGKLLFTFNHGYGLVGVTYTPDGNYIVTADEPREELKWWSIYGQELGTWSVYSPSGVAFSPDGKYLAVSTIYGSGSLYDLSNSSQLDLPTVSSSDITFSQDGNFIAAANGYSVRIWDASYGRALFDLSSHNDSVKGIAFSPDGTRMAAASEDGTVVVSDIASRESLFTLFSYAGKVFDVAFSPDGKLLATANEDGTVRLYALDVSSLTTLARTRVTRDLTCEERVRYLHEDAVCVTSTPEATATP